MSVGVRAIDGLLTVGKDNVLVYLPVQALGKVH